MKYGTGIMSGATVVVSGATMGKVGGEGKVSRVGGATKGADTRTKIISRKTKLLEEKIPLAADYQTSWDGAATTEAKVDILAQMLGLKL